MAEPEAEPAEISVTPARARRGARKFNKGLVTATAGIIAVASLGIAGIAGSAMANESDGATPVVEPFNRLSDESRSEDRTALTQEEIAAAFASRNQALTNAGDAIAEADAETTAAERQETLSSTQENVTSEAARLKQELNNLVFPADGKVGSQWGMRLHPILGYYRMHNGVDVGASCGSEIRAIYDGVVVSAQFDGASGNWVKIDHGTFRGKSLVSSSLHMTKYVVAAGDEVKKGQVIGYVGSTGLSTECHLHFETVWGGTNVDPEPLLAKES